MTTENCTACVVFPTSQHEWVAHLEGGPVGPFKDQEVALQIAIIEALRLRKLGRPARVVVRNQDVSVRLERCLCQQFGR